MSGNMGYNEFLDTLEHLEKTGFIDFRDSTGRIFLYQGINLLKDYIRINEGNIGLVVGVPDENSLLKHGLLVIDKKYIKDRPGLESRFITIYGKKQFRWMLDSAKEFDDTYFRLTDNGREPDFNIYDPEAEDIIFPNKNKPASNFGFVFKPKEANINHPDFPRFLDFTMNRDLATLAAGGKIITAGARIKGENSTVSAFKRMGYKKESMISYMTNGMRYGEPVGVEMDDVVNKIFGETGGTRTMAGIHAAYQADPSTSVIMSKATVKSDDPRYNDEFSSPGVGTVYLLRGKLGLGNYVETDSKRIKVIEPYPDPIMYRMRLKFSDRKAVDELRKRCDEEGLDSQERLKLRSEKLKLELRIDAFSWRYTYNSRGGFYDINRSNVGRSGSVDIILSSNKAVKEVAAYNPFK